MIPLWLYPLLNTSDVGEFLYSGICDICIKGRIEKSVWVVDVRVSALPYFIWGCNGVCTGKSSFKEVVRYYLAVVLNQLSERGVEGREHILSLIRDYLE